MRPLLNAMRKLDSFEQFERTGKLDGQYESTILHILGRSNRLSNLGPSNH